MTPDQYCETIAAPAGSDLYYSLLYLKPEVRQAVVAVHALREQIGRVVDERHEDQVARSKLDWWRSELDRCFAGNPQHPVTRALQAPLEHFNLPKEYFLEILDGVWMDMERRHFASFNELALYCYRVSGVVGLLSAEICGYQQRATLTCATSLGTAFRLADILLNFGRDLRQGRVYLPQETLAPVGLDAAELSASIHAERLVPVAQQLLDRVRRQFDDALQGLPAADRATQCALLIRTAIYRALLDEVEADGLHVTDHRLELTALRKLRIAWTTHRRARR